MEPSSFASLDIDTKKLKTPKRVVFGNGQTAFSHYTVYLGPILGEVAILPCMKGIILSVPSAQNRGYSVTFTDELRCVITRKGLLAPLVDEPMHERHSLFYADLSLFLDAEAFSLHSLPQPVVNATLCAPS